MEALAASIVNRVNFISSQVLGDYIANLETNQLKIAVWEGHVVLKNLKLKANIFSQWKIPLEVVYGTVGDLTITIPWSDLKNKPLKIAINNVYILANPRIDIEYDPEEEELAKQEAKQQKLLQAEEAVSKPEENTGYFSQISSTMVDNIQVSIKNIHIRYEDSTSLPGKPFGVGMTLQELSAVSTDKDWNIDSNTVNTGVIYKLLKLGHFGLYCITVSESFRKGDDKEILKKFAETIECNAKVDSNKQYILDPVSGIGKLIWTKKFDITKPTFDLNVDFDDLAFNLDDHQYATFMAIFGTMNRQARSYPYRKFRPPKAITPKLDPKVWFQYAGKCILNDIHQKKHQWSWEYFKKRRDERMQYIKLYTALRNGSIEEEQIEELNQLELHLSFDDIRFYRHVTISKLKKSAQAAKVQEKTKTPQPTGWYGWLTGASAEKNEAQEWNNQLQKLYETFDFDEPTNSDDLPKNAIQFKTTSKLGSGSFNLRKFTSKGIKNLLFSRFENLRLEYLSYPKSRVLGIRMEHFIVAEHSEEPNIFSTLIEAKHDNSGENADFFVMNLENSPLDERADNAVSIKMLPLKVVVIPRILSMIFDFFKPPKEDQDSLYQLQAAAQDAFQGVTSQTRAGLMFAIEEHKTLDLSIEADAPIFILPSDAKIGGAPVIILDAGHLAVKSNIISQQTKNNAEELLNKSLLELVDDIYDKFSVNLSAVKIMMANINEANTKDMVFANEDYFLENLDLSLIFKMCILQNSPEYTKFKLLATLPKLKLNISESKMAVLKKVSKLLTKTFIDTSETPSTPVSPIITELESPETLADAPIISRQSSAQSIAQNQVLFELKCDFKNASILLHEKVRKDGEFPGIALFEVRDINVFATIKAKETKLSASLGTFLVQDQSVGRVVSFQDLISPNYQQDEENESQKLMTFEFKAWNSSQEGSNSEIDITLNPIKFILARECVLHIYQFLVSLSDPITQTDVIESFNTQSLPRPDKSAQVKSSNKISVKITSFSLILAENSKSVGSCNFEDFEITLSSKEEFIMLAGTVGKLYLHEETGSKRCMLQIEEDKAIDFTFETLNINNTKYPGYNSALKLKAASWRFVYDQFFLGSITNYFGRFQEMKSLMDGARHAAEEQSVQIQKQAGKFYFDINIKTPIIEVPNGSGQFVDSLVFYLGEIAAESSANSNIDPSSAFVVKDRTVVNLKSVKLESLVYKEKVKQTLNMIEDINMVIQLDSLREIPGQPQSQISIFLSDVILKITNHQYRLFVELLKLISQSPQQGQQGHDEDPKPQKSSHVDYVVSFPSISLEVFDCPTKFEEPQKYSLARIIGTTVSAKVKMNGPTDLELRFTALSVIDTRSYNVSLFRDIMTPIAEMEDQFVLKYHMEPNLVEYSLMIDQPKVTFEVDHILAIKNFAVAAWYHELDRKVTPLPNAVADAQVQESVIRGRVSFIEPEFIIIKDPNDAATDAVIWIADHFVVTQDTIYTVSFQNIGMFFCVMNQRKDTQIRFLDDCNLTYIMDDRLRPDGVYNYRVSLETTKLLIRLSYQDAMLLSYLVNRVRTSSAGPANPEMVTQPVQTPMPENLSQNFRLTIKELQAVLIDDLDNLHLPIFEVGFGQIVFEMSDWTKKPQYNLGLSAYAKYFNIKNSHWEPMIESFQFSVDGRKDEENGQSQLLLLCRKKLELNVSHILVETALNMYKAILEKANKPQGQRRESRSPYIIKNLTGYPIIVWTDGRKGDTQLMKIAYGDSIDWRFDDWRTMREKQTLPDSNKIAVQIEGPSWETIKGISVDTESTSSYVMRPAIAGVLHRLVVKITLKDKVKEVTLQSTKVVENDTNIDMEIACIKNGAPKPQSGVLLKPGDFYPIPIESSHYDSVFVRPAGFGYSWCTQGIYWKDIKNSKKKSSVYIINCPAYENNTPTFKFQLNCSFHGKDQEYPMFTMKLMPPFILENLLPYDFKYSIIDRDQKQQHVGVLKKGTKEYLHTLDPMHLLALNIAISEAGLHQKEPIIITSTDLEYRDETLILKGSNDLQINLGVQYFDGNTHGRTVSIYSPYLILNKTGLDLIFRTKSFLGPAGKHHTCPGKAGDNQNILPMMYSYTSFEPLRSRSQIRIADTEWSRDLSFEAVGSSYEITLGNQSHTKDVVLGVDIQEGLGKFYMSKVVTFTPRFILRNNTGGDLIFGQPPDPKPITLKAGETMSLMHFKHLANLTEHLCVKLPIMLSTWSNPFKLTEVGSIYLKVGRIGSLTSDLIRVDTSLEKATLFISFWKEEGKWPFRIDNYTNVDVNYFQSGLEQTYTVVPGEEQWYAWDYPSAENKSLTIDINGRQRPIELTQLGSLLPFKYPIEGKGHRKGIISIDLVAEGPTIVVKLTPYDEKSSLYRDEKDRMSISSTGSSTTLENFQRKDDFSRILSSYKVRIEGIGISFISKDMREILYLTAKTLDVQMVDTITEFISTIKLKWFQVDNQIGGSANPIFVYPTVLKQKNTTEKDADRPVFFATVSHSKDTSHGVDYYQWLTVLLQELSVDLDEGLLNEILDFTKYSSNEIINYTEPCDTSAAITFPKSAEGGDRLYFESFLLQPVQVNLSFSMSEQKKHKEGRSRGTGMINLVYDIFTMTLGNIHDAPIRLHALELQHPIFSKAKFMELITLFYSREIYSQIHSFVGSADFLGNPVGLFNNVASGVKDMFYEPLQGFEITKPEEFGIEVAKGATSLVKKTVFGLSDTFSKFTGSIGKGLSVMTMDQKFQEKRRIAGRNRPKHVGQGMASGAASFVRGVGSGVTGLVSQPFQGAKEAGVEGFFMGVGKGLLGVVAKPLTGVVDMVTNVSEGIKNTTTVFDDEIERQRLPRYIGKDGILRPFSMREALGQNWLREVEGGKYFNESYLCHLEMRMEDLVCIITENYVLLVHTNKGRTEFVVPFEDIRKIEPGICEIQLAPKYGTRRWVIPCPSQESCEWLRKNIETALSDYITKTKPFD